MGSGGTRLAPAPDVENPDYLTAGSAQRAEISKRSGLRGITIPVHPAVSRYFGPSTPAGPGAPPKG